MDLFPLHSQYPKNVGRAFFSLLPLPKNYNLSYLAHVSSSLCLLSCLRFLTVWLPRYLLPMDRTECPSSTVDPAVPACVPANTSCQTIAPRQHRFRYYSLLSILYLCFRFPGGRAFVPGKTHALFIRRIEPSDPF